MATSSAPLRRLGAELRKLRGTRTQSAVGASIGRNQASLANWEQGRTKISEVDLDALLGALNAPSGAIQALKGLHKEAERGVSQWATYNLPEWLRPYVNFEEEASEVSTLN